MKRSKVSLSHYKLCSIDAGVLYPIAWYEVLPGDTVQQVTACLIRCQPLLAPLMHPLKMRIHHWYVPYTQIFDDFEDFITGGEDGLDASVFPYRESSSITESSLQDFLGVPPDSYSPDLYYSAMPERAYAHIFNEHYRDQQLRAPLVIDTTDGQDVTTNTSLQRVSWEKDYFTTCRTDPELGGEATIGFADDARVYGLGKTDQGYGSGPDSVYETDGSGTRSYVDNHPVNLNNTVRLEEDPDNAGYPNIRAATSELTMPVQNIRTAMAIENYRVARNKWGARYVEYLRHLGVRSKDGRLNTPEFLGGGRQIMQFSEVLDHGSTAGAVGAMKGHGIGAMRTRRFRRFFDEHGLVMSMLSVVPKAVYNNSLWKGFNRLTKEMFWQRELQHLEDQPVYYQEVNAAQSDRTDRLGYQDRYGEYRYHPSSVAGEFRSTLNYWHMARDFSGDIALNSTFTECTPTERVWADSESNHMYVMANHSIQARRLIARRP